MPHSGSDCEKICINSDCCVSLLVRLASFGLQMAFSVWYKEYNGCDDAIIRILRVKIYMRNTLFCAWCVRDANSSIVTLVKPNDQRYFPKVEKRCYNSDEDYDDDV